MKHRIIDPRDGVSEIDFPAYRVYFFDSDGATEEWQLVEARDVSEVIVWADSQQRTYKLYVEWPLATGAGLALISVRNIG